MVAPKRSEAKRERAMVRVRERLGVAPGASRPEDFFTPEQMQELIAKAVAHGLLEVAPDGRVTVTEAGQEWHARTADEILADEN